MQKTLKYYHLILFQPDVECVSCACDAHVNISKIEIQFVLFSNSVQYHMNKLKVNKIHFTSLTFKKNKRGREKRYKNSFYAKKNLREFNFQFLLKGETQTHKTHFAMVNCWRTIKEEEKKSNYSRQNVNQYVKLREKLSCMFFLWGRFGGFPYLRVREKKTPYCDSSSIHPVQQL